MTKISTWTRLKEGLGPEEIPEQSLLDRVIEEVVHDYVRDVVHRECQKDSILRFIEKQATFNHTGPYYIWSDRSRGPKRMISASEKETILPLPDSRPAALPWLHLERPVVTSGQLGTLQQQFNELEANLKLAIGKLLKDLRKSFLVGEYGLFSLFDFDNVGAYAGIPLEGERRPQMLRWNGLVDLTAKKHTWPGHPDVLFAGKKFAKEIGCRSFDGVQVIKHKGVPTNEGYLLPSHTVRVPFLTQQMVVYHHYRIESRVRVESQVETYYQYAFTRPGDIYKIVMEPRK